MCCAAFIFVASIVFFMQTSVLVESSMPPQVETWKQGQTKPGIIQYTGEAVEVQLRHVTQTKMIRVSEYFKDFDSLRSGFITSKAKDILGIGQKCRENNVNKYVKQTIAGCLKVFPC